MLRQHRKKAGEGNGQEESGAGSSFFSQASAVLLKNLALQRRTIIAFVFVACLPLLLVGLLLIVQFMIDAELQGRDYRCGCRCVSCCDFVPRSTSAGNQSLPAAGTGGVLGGSQSGSDHGNNVKVCHKATSEQPCSTTAQCQEYDDTTCGPQYSSYEQIAFCAVPRPPTWPALVQFPLNKYRPHGSSSGVSNDVTNNGQGSGGGNTDSSSGMAGADSGPPSFADSGLPALLPYTGRNPELAADLTAALLPRDAGVLGRQLLSALLSSPLSQSGILSQIGAGGSGGLDLCELAANAQGSNSSGSGGGTFSLGALGDIFGGQGTGDEALNEALKVFTQGASAGTNSTAESNALAVITSQMSRLFVEFDITLGTATDVSISLLLDPAFVKGSPVLGHGGGGGGGVSMGGSASIGLNTAAQQVDMSSQALPLYLISPNCTALTSGELDGPLLQQLSCGFQLALSGVPLVCATLKPEWQESQANIDRELYCGWAGSECSAQEESFFTADNDADGSSASSGSTASDLQSTQQDSGAAGTGNRRRALKGFGPLLPVNDKDLEAAAGAGAADHKEGSRILAKVREGSRTLAMDSSALFQPQGFFFPSWQATTTSATRADDSNAGRKSASAGPSEASNDVIVLPTAPGESMGKSSMLPFELSAAKEALALRSQANNHPRTLLQSSTNSGPAPSNEITSSSLFSITQFPSLVVDWGATRVTPADTSAGSMQNIVGDPTAPALDLTLWLNSSRSQTSLAPPVERWPAPINMATLAFISQAVQAAKNGSAALQPEPRGRSVGPSIKLEGLAAFPSADQALKVDIASLLGPLFFMWVMLILLPVYVFALSSERAGGQLGLMFCQGVSPTAYFAGTYVWSLGLYIVYMVVFAGFGAGSGLGLFIHTSPGIQILLYLLWFHSMFGLASWLSVFYTDVITGTMAAVAVLIFSGLVANLVVVQFVESGPEWLAILLEAIVPPFALFRALWEASQYAFLANSTGAHGLSFNNIHDPKNGTSVAFGLMAAHAAVSISCAAWYSQVMGTDAGNEGLTGPRQHPFFMLGAKLGPDDPRGTAWFTYQATLIPTRTHKVIVFLFTCIPRAVRWCFGRGAQPDEHAVFSVAATEVCDGVGNEFAGELPHKQQGSRAKGVLKGLRMQSGDRADGGQVHVSAATVAAAEAVRVGFISDDVRAEVELVEEIWDATVPTQPGQPSSVSLAELEQQHSHIASQQGQPKLAMSVLSEGSVAPVLLMRGVRKEFHLPKPFKLSKLKAPDLTCVGKLGKKAEPKSQEEDQGGREGLPDSSDVDGQAIGTKVGRVSQRNRDGFNGNKAKGGGAIGSAASAPTASKPNVKVAVAGLWLSVRRSECFGLLGPNGAGKTTALRLMQGLLEPSAGRVAVCGKDLVANQQAAAMLTGICPQHDALWSALSAEEHLQLYGRLRGLKGAELAAAVQDRLMELGLLGPVDETQSKEVQGSKPPTPPPVENGHDDGRAKGTQAVDEVGEAAGAGTENADPGAVSPSAGGQMAGVCSKVGNLCSSSAKWMMKEAATAAGLGSDLSAPAYRPISTYSGGMRRRLSVACALVGRPGGCNWRTCVARASEVHGQQDGSANKEEEGKKEKDVFAALRIQAMQGSSGSQSSCVADENAPPVPAVAFLDEPAAGLDPASRSALWQAIRSARVRGTSIVLTTHSMAEAEALGDRLGIFVSGKLRALGSTQQLAARYSGSLLLSVTTPPDQADAISQAVLREVCPSAHQVYSAGGAASWELPRSAAPLSTIMASLRRLRSNRGPGALKVLDWGLTSASLDHVFATIVAACADAEARKEEGEKQQDVSSSDNEDESKGSLTYNDAKSEEHGGKQGSNAVALNMPPSM